MSIIDTMIYSVPPIRSLFANEYQSCIINDQIVNFLHFKPSFEKKEGFRVILYFHGSGYDLVDTYKEIKTIISKILNYGVHFIAVEYPGYGSTSNFIIPSKYNFETLYDLWVTNILNKKNIKWSECLLIGHSIGTSISLILAKKHPIYKIILISPFLNIQKIIDDHMSMFTFPIEERYDNVSLINKINVPIYFIHGEKDWLVSPEHCIELYNKTSQYIRKEIILLSYCNHQIIWRYVYDVLLKRLLEE